MKTEQPQAFVKEITKMSVDFDRWYTDIVRKAELADYSGVRGCMVIRPYGYAIWEHIQRAFDDMIKSSGHENAYFPLLIPRDIFMKEADHVEGFAPEVAWVTRAGSDMKELDEPFVIRPTSETIIGTIMRKYIQSYRDLPQLLNQWCNVMRWEMRTRLFLRTAEFLWQEGHTMHATAQEAKDEVALILGYYRDISEDWLAMPVVRRQKSRAETFAGAEYSLSIEAMMRDGLALQSGTSHYMGQNFSRAYDISFANRENRREHCYTTSWGISTRLIGGLIMAHGDDSGLIMPPRVAPIQVVLVPIFRDAESREKIEAFVAGFEKEVRALGIRFKVDWRDDRPGNKFAQWEVKGVPLRLEVGPRDVDAGQLILADRLTGRAGQRPVPVQGIAQRLRDELDGFHAALFQRALDFRTERTREAADLDQFRTLFGEGSYFVWANWCEDAACETRVKEELAVTTRNFDAEEKVSGNCIVCGKPAVRRPLWARSY